MAYLLRCALASMLLELCMGGKTFQEYPEWYDRQLYDTEFLETRDGSTITQKKQFFTWHVFENNREALHRWESVEPLITQEVLEADPRLWVSWTQDELYADVERSNDVWSTIPMVYSTRPTPDSPATPGLTNRTAHWGEVFRELLPETYKFLRSLDGVYGATISTFTPNTTLDLHCGWKSLTDNTLRVHFPLVVGDRTSGVITEKVTHYHEPGHVWGFDDSLIHYGFNFGDAPRHVLLVDLPRPDHVQRGTSCFQDDEAEDQATGFVRGLHAKFYPDMVRLLKFQGEL